MDVAVTGETGAFGWAAVPDLVGVGHRVRGLRRSAAQEAVLRTLGAKPVRSDQFSVASSPTLVAGCDALLPMATGLPSIGQIVVGVRGPTGR